MLGRYSQSSILAVGAMVFIVVVLGLALRRCDSLHQAPGPRGDPAVTNVGTALGGVLAKEAAHVLGPDGGRVALLVYGLGTGRLTAGTLGESFVTSFQQAHRKEDRIQVLGYYLAEPPSALNGYRDNTRPVLATMQAARQQFPRADLWVSLIGLPQFSKAEAAEWKADSPPPLLVVDITAGPPQRANALLAEGIVSSCWLQRDRNAYPRFDSTSESADAIVSSLFEVRRGP